MALPKGVTQGKASDLIGNPDWTVDLESGTAQKNNAWYDRGVPLAIGALMGYGALTGGTGSLASVGASGGGTTATTASAPTASATGGHVSLLSKLGAIGKKIIGGGGNSDGSQRSPLADIGSVVAGAARGSSQQRIAEGNQGLDYAQLQQQAARDKYSSDLSGANAQFGAGLQGAQFNSGQQDRARKAAALQSLLSGMQDFKATPGNPAIAAAMGTSTGGARPSALTGNSAALMQLLGQAGLSAPTYSAPTPYAAPPVPRPPTAGFGERALGGVGLGMSVLGAIDRVSQPNAGGDMAGTVYNGVPEMPWTLPPDQPEQQNADFYNPNKLQARF